MGFHGESQGQHGVHLRGNEVTRDAVGQEPQRIADQLGPVVVDRQAEAERVTRAD
jgi:hypothetical protein